MKSIIFVCLVRNKPNFMELFIARQSRPQEVNITHSSFNQKLAVL